MTFSQSYGSAVTALTGYKAAGTAIQAAFVALGWTQTADTGQTDYSGLSAMPTTFATGNYSVFRSNDALSATLPLYVRVSTYATASPYYVVTVTVGFGSDGAGNITGTSIISQEFKTGSVASGGTWVVLACGNAGTVVLTVQESDASALMLLVDRSRDATGTVTGEYAYLATAGSANSPLGHNQVLFANQTSSPSVIGGICHPVIKAPSNVYNGTAMVSPVFPIIGRLGNPTPLLMVSGLTDVSLAGSVQVNLYGTTHTFRGICAALYGGFGNVAGCIRPLMLWE